MNKIQVYQKSYQLPEVTRNFMDVSGRRQRRNVHQNSEKIAVENLCYRPDVSTLEEEAEIAEIFGQKWQKKI